jgi:hypothetical protein
MDESGSGATEAAASMSTLTTRPPRFTTPRARAAAYSPDHLCVYGEKSTTVFPVDLFRIQQPNVNLIDKRGGLERTAVTFIFFM